MIEDDSSVEEAGNDPFERVDGSFLLFKDDVDYDQLIDDRDVVAKSQFIRAGKNNLGVVDGGH